MSNYQLCHKEFRDFLNILSEAYNTVEETVEATGRALSCVADLLKIVKVEIHFTAPASILVPRGENVSKIVFDKNIAMKDIPITFKYTTGEGGTTLYDFYLEVDADSENKELCDQLDNICKMMFSFNAKSRMAIILSRLSLSDMTTLLPNTEGYMQFIQKIIEAGKIERYCAFFINIKDFKYVNKLVDYKAGDRVLKAYVDQIIQFINSDEIVARLGGDNFTALIEKSRIDAFIQYISNIRISLEIGPRIHKFNFGMRAGVMRLDSTIQNPGQVMMGTSIAMQIAKSAANQNIVWYSPEMNAQIIKEKEISMNFGPGLAKHEFVAFYQPKINLQTNTIVGAEALARWVRNDKIEPPADFIPFLERDGSICKLDFYILDCVCKDLKKWRSEGNGLVRISSNFSRWNLRDPEFAQKIAQTVDRYEVDHKYIEIEVTETSNFEDYEAMVAFIREVKALGFTTAIDDFGAGYSSLNLLKNLRVDVLKMDKCFLDGVEMEQRDKIVLENMISMAQALKVEVIAEGVETRENRDYLKALNCDTVQGYYYDKPMSVEEFEKKLKMTPVYDI